MDDGIGADGPDARTPETVAVVGAGRVATALAVLLVRAGHRVVGASGRAASRERVATHLPGVPFLSGPEAARAAEVVVLGVPDDAIAATCDELAGAGALGPGRLVVHLSGSVDLGALSSAVAAGARALALHPLQSFPDVETGVERLPASAVAVTGSDAAAAAAGERLAREIGARPFALADEERALYHAAAVFCANYLVTVEAVAEDLFERAGVSGARSIMEPLARTSFDRVFDVGPGAALTGPAVRGDAGTIRRNLQALAERAPEAVELYAALARAAASLAERAGRLDAAGRARVEDALEGST